MEREKGKKKRYDRDFKMSAVKMVTEGGHKSAEVAISLGIPPNQLYNWKRKYSDNGDKAFPGKGKGAGLKLGDRHQCPRMGEIYLYYGLPTCPPSCPPSCPP
jgi:transposase